MVGLIQNEWVKIFRQISTYIMIGFLVVVLILLGVLTKFIESNSEPVSENWKEDLQQMVDSYKQDLALGSSTSGEVPDGVTIEADEGYYMTPSLRSFYEREVALMEYRIEHDIPPASEYSVWTFVNDSTGLISLVGLLVIIVASGIVANEFSKGTIKNLLIKPYKRWKILLAKYFTTIFFLVFMLAILFISSLILGWLLFGTGQDTSSIHLMYMNGKVVEQNIVIYLMITYFFNSLSIFLLATMAFMISSVFRVSGLAIGISIFLLFTGDLVTNLLAGKFEWAKYILFANTNLMVYFDGTPYVEGMTIIFSIIMMLIYFLLFMVLAFSVFVRRDVAS